MMKTQFGTAISRFLWGGVCLSPLESGLLLRMVDELPAKLRTVVEAQFECYNLAQREADGRAINFYRKKFGRVDFGKMPLLAMSVVEAPLVRTSFSIDGEGTEHHAVLTAVNGRAFCLTFDEDMRPHSARSDFAVTRVKRTWRSNFTLG
jgi:hypothetical protein